MLTEVKPGTCLLLSILSFHTCMCCFCGWSGLANVGDLGSMLGCEEVSSEASVLRGDIKKPLLLNSPGHQSSVCSSFAHAAPWTIPFCPACHH